MKTFQFGNYDKCAFSIGYYEKEKIIDIEIVEVETENRISQLTYFDNIDKINKTVRLYDDERIQDGKELKKPSKILQDLGIIEILQEYIEQVSEVEFAICRIDFERLEKYTKNKKYKEYT